MNADGAGTPDGLVSKAAGRVQQAGAATHALYVASSALSGAVLYLLATWPSHAATPRTMASSNPIANPPSLQAQPVEQARLADIHYPGNIASVTLLEAVRAVAGESNSVVLAQAAEHAGNRPSTTAATGSPVAALPIAASAAAEPGATLNTSAPPVAASASAAGNSAGTTVAAPNIAASVDTRQPPPGSDGPNRISIPPAALQPPPATGAAQPILPVGGTNRITVPPTQPPH